MKYISYKEMLSKFAIPEPYSYIIGYQCMKCKSRFLFRASYLEHFFMEHIIRETINKGQDQREIYK